MRKKSNTRHQTREPWELRALKLQLLAPNWFYIVVATNGAHTAGRNERAFQFSSMERAGVLQLLDMGPVTEYRRHLLTKACKKHHLNMRLGRRQ